jgi:cell division protein FtsQ
MRKVLNITVTVVLLAGLVYVIAFAKRSYYNTPLADWRVNIHVPGPDTLIFVNEIEALLLHHHDTLIGSNLSTLDIDLIAQTLAKIPYIKSNDIKLTLQGELDIDLQQKEPIVRIMNDGRNFYVDEEGKFIPIKPGRGAYVPVVSGDFRFKWNDPEKINVADIIEDSPVYLGWHIINITRKDTLLSKLIDQVHFEENGDIRIITKIRGPIVRLGDYRNLEDKLWQLKWFYLKVLPQKGWNTYNEINMKYNKQIICSK